MRFVWIEHTTFRWNGEVWLQSDALPTELNPLLFSLGCGREWEGVLVFGGYLRVEICVLCAGVNPLVAISGVHPAKLTDLITANFGLRERCLLQRTMLIDRQTGIFNLGSGISRGNRSQLHDD